MVPNHRLVLTGLHCPLPVLRVKKELAALKSGDTLEVIVTDLGAPDDLAAFCHQTGHILLASDPINPETYRLVLQHK